MEITAHIQILIMKKCLYTLNLNLNHIQVYYRQNSSLTIVRRIEPLFFSEKKTCSVSLVQFGKKLCMC